jgi:hypothetical protein
MKDQGMKGTIIIFLNLALVLTSCDNLSKSVLIEAESFKDKGGWVVDPQFVEQMGSPYLLAHGLGIPVKNASTEVKFDSKGEYNVWVRTMNWAPGKWDAPGRFRVTVNGKELDSTLGTGTREWKWHFAGKIPINEKSVVVELKDLTGFEGRCDALFFTRSREKPPDLPDILTEWRKEELNEKSAPDSLRYFDLVVVGGGIAGCAASIAAAEQGMSVALIHDRPVLGGNSSSEIRVHTEGITWKSERILNMLNTVWWPNGSPDALFDDRKRQENILKYKNINLFLNWRAFKTNTQSDSITSVDARNTSSGEIIRFSAPLYIDCTGDGWIGFWAGAEYMYGREDSSTYGENWAEYGDLWSPATQDNRVMGSSVLWRTVDCGKPAAFQEVPWAMESVGDYSATSGTWKWEYSDEVMDQIADAEFIRDHMLKAIYGTFYNAKKEPANANLMLEWVSYLVGKRESRRLKGDYIYTFNDERKMAEFPDAVVMEKRNIDVHYQQALLDSSKPDFLSEALYYNLDHYYIPYRSLYSVNIKNLFMAGRCFSCSHIGLGGPRVMNTTGQMGVAVGYAASLCKKYSTNPRGIYRNYINELKDLVYNSSDK